MRATVTASSPGDLLMCTSHVANPAAEGTEPPRGETRVSLLMDSPVVAKTQAHSRYSASGAERVPRRSSVPERQEQNRLAGEDNSTRVRLIGTTIRGRACALSPQWMNPL